MDLAEICRVMGRRWYVLLPGLLLTAALTVGAYVKVPLTYQSQSTVMLLNSQKATVAFDGNPFLSTQTSLTGMADSLVRNLNSDASLATLRQRGATGSCTAKIADNALGPLMWLTASGTDKQAVLASDKVFTAYARERLEEFQNQQGVTSVARIRMTTIVAPQNPVAKTKTRIEYLALAALLGIVVSVAASFYAEARRRPAPGKAVAPGEAASQTPAAATGGDGGGPEVAAAVEGSRDSQGSDRRDCDRRDSGRHAARTVRPAPRWSSGTDGAGAEDGREEEPEESAAGRPGTAATESHGFV
jgi:hypothetical protein